MKISIKFGENALMVLSFILFVACLIANILNFSISGICASIGFGLFVALYNKVTAKTQSKTDELYELTKSFNLLKLKYTEAMKDLEKAETNIVKLENSIKFEHSNSNVLKDEIAQYKEKLDNSINMINTLSDKAKILKDDNEKLIEDNNALKDAVASLYAHIKDNSETVKADNSNYVEKSIVIEDSSTNIDSSANITSASTDDVLPLEEVVEKPKKTNKRKKSSKK
jgi:methyl-accepting chemotaxis protein